MGQDQPRPFAELARRSEELPPDELVVALREAVSERGASDLTLFLVDYEQGHLRSVPLPGEPDPAMIPVTGTVAGRAFATRSVLEAVDGDSRVVWVPVAERANRLGVLSVAIPSADALDPDDAAFYRELGTIAGHLLVAADRYTDVYHRLRGRQEMSLAAEIQWSALPPTSFETPSVALSGHLEPAYDVGGDTFDYAMTGDVLEFALVDAMGHGLEASFLATTALARYRQSRRASYDLSATFELMDATVRGIFGGASFVTAVLARLDCLTGTLTWCNAGHPRPMLLRDGRVVDELASEPALPLGLGPSATEVGAAALQPGDRVLVYTDGVVDARPRGGEPFGEDRLRDFLEQEAASGAMTTETLRRLTRRLTEHLGTALNDDATVLLVEWRGAR